MFWGASASLGLLLFISSSDILMRQVTNEARAYETSLESIRYTRRVLHLLDQRKLPFETVFDEIRSVDDICTAILEMRVRGAPAIAISAALAIVIAAGNEMEREECAWQSTDDAKCFLLESCDRVMNTRPTAVNLSTTLMRLKRAVEAVEANTPMEVVAASVQVAESMFAEDVACNMGIMRHGALHLVKFAKRKKLSILTICNTGALATSRYGTALGVVRQLFYDNKLEQLYVCETRPWNQGARLTVYECVQEHIPCTLICDSAASALMQSRPIDAVIVGADRICQNGDVANKIGTYNLSVAATHHGVPFFVAAPSTTLDPQTLHGSDVKIEERETTEMTHNMTGLRQRVVADGPLLQIWNPVFDITPAALVTGGIITERGVFPPATVAPFFDISRIMAV